MRSIDAIRAKSQILAPPPERARYHPGNVERIIVACLRMANLWHLWHRVPEDWIAPDASPFVQFRSFVNHLFAKFPVPNVMVPVWLSDGHELWLIDLYLHLAAGRGIRQFHQLQPFRITKRMACCLMSAPNDLHLLKALRWAQVRSLGGDHRLARLLSSCIQHTTAQDEYFWESVIRFLVQNQPISDEEVAEIITFILSQRFEPAELVTGAGTGLQPLQPQFTLEGRSLMSLRRHMANWRIDLGITQPFSLHSTWKTTEIKPFYGSNSDGIWTIEELQTGKELYAEGAIMRHCVVRYIRSCKRRHTSIWSMRLKQAGRRRRVLTIEVVPETKTIRQAKGRYNARPSPSQLEILQRWALQERLTLVNAN